MMEDIPQPPAEFAPEVYVAVFVVGVCFAILYIARAISRKISGKEERDACNEEE